MKEQVQPLSINTLIGYRESIGTETESINWRDKEGEERKEEKAR
jgi:hypothetical protein